MATKEISLDSKILDSNDRLARKNRERFDEHKVYVINLLSSPGSGKTSTILSLIDGLKDEFAIGVIEGDIASDVDAQTIKKTGCPAVQINTGGICHLEAKMISKAIDALDLASLDLIILENVGNLVCPVDFDLGEDIKAMILSVPEGDDKLLKYPGVFQAANLVIVNKVDTLAVFDFDMDAFDTEMSKLNPQAQVKKISATKGDGVAELVEWLRTQIRAKRAQNK
ncbi:MAG: hydrogenase nickel incorporation protein HypB [Coriobacteriia bacterium]|nr:hydrogenase nickel incorporation protein HypB [Coriobacteriia bacterium]